MKQKGKYSLWQRILALITVIMIIGLVIAAIVCAVIGSRYYMGFLFAAIVFPILIYVIVWLAGVLKGIGEKKQSESS